MQSIQYLSMQEHTRAAAPHPVMAKLHVCARFGGEPAAFSVSKADCRTSFAGVEKSRADFIWLPLFKGWLEVSQKRPTGAQQHLSVTLTRIALARCTHHPPTHPQPQRTIRARGMPHATRTHPAPNDAIFLPFAPHLTSIISRPCRRQSLLSSRQLRRRRPRAEFFTGCKSAHHSSQRDALAPVLLAMRLISSPEEEERLFDASS
jgi:hypothetical protein